MLLFLLGGIGQRQTLHVDESHRRPRARKVVSPHQQRPGITGVDHQDDRLPTCVPGVLARHVGGPDAGSVVRRDRSRQAARRGSAISSRRRGRPYRSLLQPGQGVGAGLKRRRGLARDGLRAARGQRARVTDDTTAADQAGGKAEQHEQARQAAHGNHRLAVKRLPRAPVTRGSGPYLAPNRALPPGTRIHGFRGSDSS